MAVKNHVSLVTTVTGVASSTVINAKSISWITNHSASEYILFNFEETVGTSGTFRVDAGVTVTNLNTPVNTIYYVCSGASATTGAFSLFGIAQ
ncbi:MAG: hypothetical protein WDA59_08780 [Methanofastidiosum sp.]